MKRPICGHCLKCRRLTARLLREPARSGTWLPVFDQDGRPKPAVFVPLEK